MIINNKLYLPPPKKNADIKEMFAYLVDAGAGLDVGTDGLPKLHWTPERLVEVICNLDREGKGVDLRTVQLWFQQNDKGISSVNINLISKVFGCGDPLLANDWRVAFRKGQIELRSKRKATVKVTQPTTVPSSVIPHVKDMGTKKGFWYQNLAQKSEALFTSGSSLDLSVLVFSFCIILGFVSYILGVESVTYTLDQGSEKQVGFFWAPNWMLIGIILLPVFLYFICELLKWWKQAGRNTLIVGRVSEAYNTSWADVNRKQSVWYWAVLIVCFAFVFLLQWAGVYLRALSNGDAGNLMLDWTLIATIKPELISYPEAVTLTFIAFLHTATNSFLFLIGLILLQTIVFDFVEAWAAAPSDTETDNAFWEGASKIITGVYRCTILGLFMILCIKIQAVYLLTNVETFSGWLIRDSWSIFSANISQPAQFEQRALAHFSSFLLLFVTCMTFLFCLFKMRKTLKEKEARYHEIPMIKMLVVAFALMSNYFTIGVVPGFSLFLGVTTLIAGYSLYNPILGKAPVKNG